MNDKSEKHNIKNRNVYSERPQNVTNINKCDKYHGSNS